MEADVEVQVPSLQPMQQNSVVKKTWLFSYFKPQKKKEKKKSPEKL